jgi:adenine specific DNA methylase Mod
MKTNIQICQNYKNLSNYYGFYYSYSNIWIKKKLMKLLFKGIVFIKLKGKKEEDCQKF